MVVVLLIMQWSFKRFQLTEVAFLTCRGRELQVATPEYMNDLRKSSQLGVGVYSRLQLVDLVSRHDMSEVYETQFF